MNVSPSCDLPLAIGRFRVLAVVTLALVLPFTSLSAQQTYTWAGDGTSLWGNSNGWVGNPSPLIFDNQTDIIFDNNTVVNRGNAVSIGGAKTIRSLTIGANYVGSTTATFDIRTYDTFSSGAANLTFAADSDNASITVAQSTSGAVQVRLGNNNGGNVVLNSDLDLAQNNSYFNAAGFQFDGPVSGTGTINKTGLGEVRLVRDNSGWSGGMNINEGNVTIFSNPNAMGTGAWTLGGGANNTSFSVGSTQTYNNNGGLVVAAGAGTRAIQNYNSGANANPTLNGALDLSAGHDVIFQIDIFTADTADRLTAAGVVHGTGGIVKTGSGRLTLASTNTYTGATVVHGGILELASTSGAAAGATGSVSVADGATLLILQNEQINDSAAVTLSGGTIQRGSGVSEVFGNLSLATDSSLDFGTGSTGTLSFGTYTPSALLTVHNFLPGNTLTFGSDLTTLINDGELFSFDSPFNSDWDSSTGTFTITAIPVTAVADGNWSDAGTWDHDVPAAGDEVVIPEGITVTINGDFTCGKIKVHGKLEVARADTSLTCDSIMVMGPGSLFEIGTPSQRFTHKFTLTLKGLASGSRGMMGAKFIGAHNGGRLEFHGEERVSWTRLGANAAAGASFITVLEPVDWRPGEEILVTSTSINWNQAEKRVVASVTPDGLTVNLTSPLTHFHSGETRTHTRPTDGKTWSIDLRAEVGLLSRNVLIQGDAQSEVSGFGGHIMVMNKEGCCETPGVGNIQGVELYRMGQKGMLGRYPFHWHMLLNGGEGQYFRNNSVHRSFNRAITIHGTESTLVEDNFCYDHIGHGLFLEDGSERFNTIRRNVVVLSKRPAPGEEVTPSDNELDEFQNRTPASYWITNPNNIFEDNVAAGTQGTGFWFAFPTSPMGASAVEPYFTGLEPHKEPLGKFDRNTAHSCMNGFDINDQLDANHSIVPNGAWENNGPFFLNDCVWYSNNAGIYAGIGQRRQNVVYYNNTFADNQIAVFLATYQLVEESLLIADSGLGHFTGRPTMYAVYDGAGRMKSNHMVGWHHPDSRLLSNPGAATKHPNHRFEGFTWDQPGPPTNILPNYDIVPPPNTVFNHPAHPRVWAQVILDIDGSITGTPNSSIIGNNRFMVTGQEHQPANWANNLVSPHRFAQMRAGYNLDSDFNPNVSVVREKAGTPTAGVYYINGFKEHHQLPFIVNEDFLYTYHYESLPSSNRINFTFDDAEIGDTVTVRIKEFGRHSNLAVSRMVSHSSLSSLMSATESGYYAEPDGDLYLRPVATKNYNNGAYVVTWSGDIALPVWDSDGDGTSDATEAATGNNPFDFPPVPAESYEQWADRFGLAGTDRDENANPDGDGFSNSEEYIAGTDPTDPGSHFAASAEMTGQGMALTFNTIEGRNYRVMRSVDLVGWEPLGSAIPGNGATVEMTDTDPPEARAFYRVLVSLP